LEIVRVKDMDNEDLRWCGLPVKEEVSSE